MCNARNSWFGGQIYFTFITCLICAGHGDVRSTYQAAAHGCFSGHLSRIPDSLQHLRSRAGEKMEISGLLRAAPGPPTLAGQPSACCLTLPWSMHLRPSCAPGCHAPSASIAASKRSGCHGPASTHPSPGCSGCSASPWRKARRPLKYFNPAVTILGRFDRRL